ncbi:hypothetical protein D5086_031408 [Populus alba]|uniref:Uncharacterized protein n=1 Tax=Populus alba TaxID=43335 RepID=A0ACC4AIH8_POPAL
MLKRKTKQRAVLASVDIIQIRNRSLSTPRTCTSNLRFARVKGGEVAPDKRNAVDGVIWFRSSGDVGGEASVGLSLEIVGGIDEVGARKSNIEYFLCLACLDTTE